MHVSRSESDRKGRLLKLSGRIFNLLQILSLAVFAKHLLCYLYVKLKATENFSSPTSDDTSEVPDSQITEIEPVLWNSPLPSTGFGLDEVLVSLMLVGCVLRHWPDLLDPNARSSQCKTSCVNFVADYVLRLADIQSDEKKIKLSQTARDPPTSEDGDSQLQASQKDNKRQDTMGLDRRADKTTEVRSEMLGLDGWEENSLTKVKQTKESSPNKKKLLLKYHSHSTMLKSLMRYKMKADTLRHVTESKQRMLGALCVQRRSLASDLATLMELVRTSRNHLDNQREVNRNLLLKIEQLCGPSCVSDVSGNDICSREVSTDRKDEFLSDA
ncbi:uncharacterized protein LOC112565145 isoform X2 [Pomacea canaliculata]|uniref:uncharacterized protein LOC112565145 isoform X2 n=1 Tax=Pomacea canaliculata TaxID=400727 RepID=UPI000D73E650|nr:uncharacterized protein LOC112565145 isoform X2 [Pomacea canaliculata]